MGRDLELVLEPVLLKPFQGVRERVCVRESVRERVCVCVCVCERASKSV